MHRESILQQLNDYHSRWPGEATAVQQLIQFVASHAACFERTLQIGHVTGSAWVVNQAGTHVLLTHHRKLNKWLQLGGHADGDPDMLQVAQREAQEESGLEQIVPLDLGIFDIDIHLIPERGTEPAHYHYDIRYAMQALSGDDYVVSDESHDLSWVEIKQLGRFTDEVSMLRMAVKWEELYHE
jgi:8-oxo-dGTP pyrophosphatase MutT (NUDIX family)